MRQGFARITFVTLSTILLLTGCPWFILDGAAGEDDAGSLRLHISTGSESRTVAPPVVMEIGTYEVTVSGPGTTQTQSFASSQTTTTFTGLDVGTWTVTVNAYNTETPAVIIAVGSEPAIIEGGMTTAVEVQVTPVAGQGTLNVDVSWPDDLLSEPGMPASITPESGTAEDISDSFALTDNTGSPDTFSYGGSWEAGYYILSLSLEEGSEVVWADVWTIRIIESQTSTLSVVLSESDVNLSGTGSAHITIVPELRNPYTITFDQEPAAVPTAGDTTITATLDPNDPPDDPPYRWYLDGVQQTGYTDNTITFGPSGIAVSDGRSYELSLIVEHGTVLSSYGFSFVADSSL